MGASGDNKIRGKIKGCKTEGEEHDYNDISRSKNLRQGDEKDAKQEVPVGRGVEVHRKGAQEARAQEESEGTSQTEIKYSKEKPADAGFF